jgi:hypothetical protein
VFTYMYVLPCVVSHAQVKVKINAMNTARVVPAGKREDISDSESGGWRATQLVLACTVHCVWRRRLHVLRSDQGLCESYVN